MTFRLVAACGLLALLAGSASAGIIDLTTAGASGSGTDVFGGTFLVEQIDPQSTGTGVISSFVRLSVPGSVTSEQGYNTSLTRRLDEVTDPNFTRALLLSEVPVVNILGTDYRQFLLDINQNRGQDNELLSLNQIQIFQANSDQDNYSSLTPASAGSAPQISFGAGVNEIFRLNTSGTTNFNYEIKLNYELNTGSGSGDMFLYVANSAFSGAFSNVILYSQFGSPSGSWAQNDGFEEWSVLQGSDTPQTPVPEPGTLALLGLGAFGLFLARRRKQS